MNFVSRFRQARPHTGHDLLGRKFEVKAAPISVAAIGGDLLERLNEFSGALEIRDELVCSVATRVSEPCRAGNGAPGLRRSGRRSSRSGARASRPP